MHAQEVVGDTLTGELVELNVNGIMLAVHFVEDHAMLAGEDINYLPNSSLTVEVGSRQAD